MINKIGLSILSMFLLASCASGPSNSEISKSVENIVCLDIDEDLAREVLDNDEAFVGCEVSVTDSTVKIHVAIVEEYQLVALAKRYNWWNETDAARMLRTRALDGTQTSSNGKTSWIYHPDNGLEIIIER